MRLVPPELHKEEEEILARLGECGRIDHFETTRLHKDGSRIPVSVTISPVQDASGTVIGASKIVRDVKMRQQNEESRFRLAAIVDSADDAIVSKDLNGVVRTWNDGARRTFGYTAAEMIGQPILRLIPAELQHEEGEILRKIRAGERIEHYETIRVRKDGERIQVSVTISPIRDESGRVIGASKIARDISDRKRLERLRSVLAARCLRRGTQGSTRSRSASGRARRARLAPCRPCRRERCSSSRRSATRRRPPAPRRPSRPPRDLRRPNTWAACRRRRRGSRRRRSPRRRRS